MSAAEVRAKIEEIVRAQMLRLTTNEADVDVVAPMAVDGICDVIGLPKS